MILRFKFWTPEILHKEAPISHPAALSISRQSPVNPVRSPSSLTDGMFMPSEITSGFADVFIGATDSLVLHEGGGIVNVIVLVTQ
jgi:hypothetical protein